MSKHTPGPWAVHLGNVWSEFNETDDEPGSQVAFVIDGQHEGANARLIAAAPELLAVARELVRQFGRVSPIGTGGLYELIQDANAAIAKATGEQA